MKDDGEEERVAASKETPAIPGLYIFPGVLEDETAHVALTAIAEDDLFSGGKRDQVMLFDGPRASPLTMEEDFDPLFEDDEDESTLPAYLIALLSAIETETSPHLPPHVSSILFRQPLARQIIINLYPPGEGISPHVDLPHRYADGILGVSLCGGCVMVMRHEGTQQEHHVYLPPHTVYCLTGEARWEWSHGIEGKMVDVVRDSAGRRITMMRDLRVSVTFRWMKEGADELVEPLDESC